MQTSRVSFNKTMLPDGVALTLLLSEFLVLAFRLSAAPLHHDEGLAILLGRETLVGDLSGAGAQHTGSVLIHPLLASLGDQVLGLLGSRGISVLFGILLSLMVYIVTSLLFGKWTGVLALGLWVLQAPVLHVSKMGLYDVVSASFLGMAFALIVWAEQGRGSSAGIVVRLTLGVVFLCLAAMTKYVTALYLPVFVVYLMIRFPLRRVLLPTILGAGLVVGYIVFVLGPSSTDVLQQASWVIARGQAAFDRLQIAGHLGHWLWPLLLLSLAGLGFREERKRILVLMALATPVVGMHLFSGGEQGLQKNVVQPLFFLAPAAAWSLQRLMVPFRWAAGINLIGLPYVLLAALFMTGTSSNLKWLERSYPDYAPAVAYIGTHADVQSAIVTDADYLLKYALSSEDRPIYPSYWVTYHGRDGIEGAVTFLRDRGPRYVVLDSYYGRPDQRKRLMEAMGGDYALAWSRQQQLSWGNITLSLYERSVNP